MPEAWALFIVLTMNNSTRDVAIKVLPPGSLADEAARKRFRKEALSLARLNHPNIATVHEFGSQDGVDFLVIEYIAGITLDAKLASGPLPPAEVVRFGGQLASGLEAAHQRDRSSRSEARQSSHYH